MSSSAVQRAHGDVFVGKPMSLVEQKRIQWAKEREEMVGLCGLWGSDHSRADQQQRTDLARVDHIGVPARRAHDAYVEEAKTVGLQNGLHQVTLQRRPSLPPIRRQPSQSQGDSTPEETGLNGEQTRLNYSTVYTTGYHNGYPAARYPVACPAGYPVACPAGVYVEETSSGYASDSAAGQEQVVWEDAPNPHRHVALGWQERPAPAPQPQHPGVRRCEMRGGWTQQPAEHPPRPTGTSGSGSGSGSSTSSASWADDAGAAAARARWGDRGVGVGHLWEPCEDADVDGPNRLPPVTARPGAPSWLHRGLRSIDGNRDSEVTSQVLVVSHPDSPGEQGSPPSTADPDDNACRSFLRGQNVPVEADILEERQKRRAKALEHQSAIRKQLEERDRRRKEERDRRLREERLEEERLRREQDEQRRRLEQEQRRQREKEEQEQRRAAAMLEALQEAERLAREQKSKQSRKHVAETARQPAGGDSPRASPRDSPRPSPRASPRKTPRSSPRSPPHSSRRSPTRSPPRSSQHSPPRSPPRLSQRSPPRSPPRSSPRSPPRSPPRSSPRTVQHSPPATATRTAVAHVENRPQKDARQKHHQPSSAESSKVSRLDSTGMSSSSSARQGRAHDNVDGREHAALVQDGAAELAERLGSLHVAESAVVSQDGERNRHADETPLLFSAGREPPVEEADVALEYQHEPAPAAPLPSTGVLGEHTTGWFPVLEFLQPAGIPQELGPSVVGGPPHGLALVLPAGALGPREHTPGHAGSPALVSTMYPGHAAGRVLTAPQMAMLMSQLPAAATGGEPCAPGAARLLTPTKFRRRLREVATQTSAGLRRRGGNGGGTGSGSGRRAVRGHPPLGERPKWGVNRPGTMYRTQSEKDPNYHQQRLQRLQRLHHRMLRQLRAGGSGTTNSCASGGPAGVDSRSPSSSPRGSPGSTDGAGDVLSRTYRICRGDHHRDSAASTATRRHPDAAPRTGLRHGLHDHLSRLSTASTAGTSVDSPRSFQRVAAGSRPGRYSVREDSGGSTGDSGGSRDSGAGGSSPREGGPEPGEDSPEEDELLATLSSLRQGLLLRREQMGQLEMGTASPS
ncbi:serine/arginine repetitive matrix protein 2-like [Frankliniella occidentalis]|uniref:Serine/arginine repetitive matrix protein 2-like n=1 Tax=Frankliniella occidentalis TaxID=133901 RepID=A0A9C6U146_FRAOC|nr:serine/arginine repetitive matrix protein 2-like [Frankliniella occidentalis]